VRELLTTEGYEQTKDKLRKLEQRLAALEKDPSIDPDHMASVRRGYNTYRRELLEDIKLYEAKHKKRKPVSPA
jgi:hypothetical protein